MDFFWETYTPSGQVLNLGADAAVAQTVDNVENADILRVTVVWARGFGRFGNATLSVNGADVGTLDAETYRCGRADGPDLPSDCSSVYIERADLWDFVSAPDGIVNGVQTDVAYVFARDGENTVEIAGIKGTQLVVKEMTRPWNQGPYRIEVGVLVDSVSIVVPETERLLHHDSDSSAAYAIEVAYAAVQAHLAHGDTLAGFTD